jgi:hypothetical protein
MTTQTHDLSEHYHHEDLMQTFVKKGFSILENLHKSLQFIEEIVNEDPEIKEWILKQNQGISACKVEDAYKAPYPSIDLMGHNPGNNKVLCFSILFKISKDDVSLEPCITQREYEYKSDHRSGFPWNRIITSHRTRSNTTFNPGFSVEGSDSIWINHMCEQMLTLEDARKILKAYIAYMIEHYE